MRAGASLPGCHASVTAGVNFPIASIKKCGIEVAKVDLTTRVKFAPISVPPIPSLAFALDFTGLALVKLSVPIISLPDALR